MKKTNIILVISLIVLLSIVIVLCLVIRHLSFDNKVKEPKEEISDSKEEISSLLDSDDIPLENNSSNNEENENTNESSTTIINNNYYITNYIDSSVDKDMNEGNESKIKSTYNVLTVR